MNVPILIHKGIGKGSSQNLGIEEINNSEASCLCARDYKGISRMRANATIVGGVEDIEDYIKTKFDRPLVKYNEDKEVFEIRQATKQGYIECKNGGVADLNYPESKLRRGRVQEDGDITPALTAESSGLSVLEHRQDRVYDSNGLSPTVTHSRFMPNISNGLRIRKLTPKECWRLQGWGFRREDGTWDDTAFEKAKAAGVSDSQLYKQAGNGCSANITEAIGLALMLAEKETPNGKE